MNDNGGVEVTWKRKPLDVITRMPTLKLQWCNTQINDGRLIKRFGP
jgi:hypothetical protein